MKHSTPNDTLTINKICLISFVNLILLNVMAFFLTPYFGIWGFLVAYVITIIIFGYLYSKRDPDGAARRRGGFFLFFIAASYTLFSVGVRFNIFGHTFNIDINSEKISTLDAVIALVCIIAGTMLLRNPKHAQQPNESISNIEVRQLHKGKGDNIGGNKVVNSDTTPHQPVSPNNQPKTINQKHSGEGDNVAGDKIIQ